MLSNNMTLRQVIDFEPNDLEMLELPLVVAVYLKVSIVSYSKDDNYDFIRFFFKDEEIKEYFYNYENTLFLDYDGSNTTQERVVTVFELYSTFNCHNTIIYLEDLLKKYEGNCDLIFDLFTQDNHKYRLSELDGSIKTEEIISNSQKA